MTKCFSICKIFQMLVSIPIYSMLRWLVRVFCRVTIIKGIIISAFVLFFYINVYTNDGNIKKDSSKNIAGFLQYSKDLPISQDVNLSKSLSSNSPVLQNDSYSDWVQVKGSKMEVFLYSAYYDLRLNYPSVRLVAILKRKYKIKQCQIWTASGLTIKTEAISKAMHENWALPYSASFVLCKGFKIADDDVVIKVAVVLPDISSLETQINVSQMNHKEIEGEFSVCVKSFHYNYNRAVWLVEFIEFHRILGVQKFFFYNHTVGKDVEEVLQYYIRKNVVVVYPWTLPVKSQKDIRTEGIFAALNDCNLKNVGRYKYTLMIDLDEYIVPRMANDYKTLLAGLSDKTTYIFQNVFFYLYWDNDTTASEQLYGSPNSIGTKLFGSETEGPYLLTAYKTTRISVPHKHGSRSKYITKPDKTIECGNHYVWDAVGGKNVLNVKPDIALVHHYRICEYGGFDCLKNKHQIDTTVLKWLPELVKGVAETCSTVFPLVGKCPKAPELGSPW